MTFIRKNILDGENKVGTMNSMDTLFKAILVRLITLILIVLAVMLALRAEADDYVAVGLGMFNNAKHSRTEAKFGQIGHRDYWIQGVFSQYELGGWFQTPTDDGRKSSIYGAAQLGIEASDLITVRVAVGPAIVAVPDSYLGGRFPQFTEDLFVGLLGKEGNTIGFKYKHLSSAGLQMPNEGRDFGTLEIAVPF